MLYPIQNIEFTSTALPRTIKAKLPFFKFYFLLEIEGSQFFIKKVSIEAIL